MGGRVTYVVDHNWIETEARDEHRTRWTIMCAGEVVHAEEQAGDDASGAKAFEAGLRWATVHCPGVAFHWRHRSLAAAVGRLHAPGRGGGAPGAVSDGVPEQAPDDDDAATRPARRGPVAHVDSCRR